MSMDELIESLQHCVAAATAGLHLVKIYSTPALCKAMLMTSVEHAALWVAAGTIAQAENCLHNKKRESIRHDNHDSSATSGRRPDTATKTKSPSEPDSLIVSIVAFATT